MVDVSIHAKERYAKRIMNKDDESEIKRYAIENSEKITSDINKMIEYGNEIYTGKKVEKNSKNTTISVYVKDTWIVLVDKQRNNVITLYKVDLVGDDNDKFNLSFVSLMLEKLKVAQDMLNEKVNAVKKDNLELSDVVKDNESTINKYRSFIKNLEAINEGYREIMNNNSVTVDIAEEKVTDIVNKLIGKKEF